MCVFLYFPGIGLILSGKCVYRQVVAVRRGCIRGVWFCCNRVWGPCVMALLRLRSGAAVCREFLFGGGYGLLCIVIARTAKTSRRGSGLSGWSGEGCRARRSKIAPPRPLTWLVIRPRPCSGARCFASCRKSLRCSRVLWTVARRLPMQPGAVTCDLLIPAGCCGLWAFRRPADAVDCGLPVCRLADDVDYDLQARRRPPG